MNTLDNKIVGLRIRRARESRKLSREKFSEKCGISSQFLVEIEQGKKGMSAETLYKICSAFELSADYMLMGKIEDVKGGSPILDILNSLDNDDREKMEQVILLTGSLISRRRD